ncbi:MAG: hypothetical protein JWO94_2157 [Verrucomicrobiaceae bacterium]|nr:hypothetical protein [Verrucomicrobiaceae bacterium]
MKLAVFVSISLAAGMTGGIVGYHLGKAQAAGQPNGLRQGFEARLDAPVPSGPALFAVQAASAGGKHAAGDPDAARLDGLLTDFSIERAKAAVASLSVGQIQASLTHLAFLPSSDERNMLRALLYGRWAALNPEQAWKAAFSDPLEDRNNWLRSAVGTEWLKINPEEAFKAMMSIPAGRERQSVTERAMSSWGKTNLADAIAFQNAHPDLPISENFVYEGVAELCKSQPAQAAGIALGINNSRARNYALSMAMDRWAGTDPVGAIGWAESISNPVIQKEALHQAVVTWSVKNPQAALEFADKLQSVRQREDVLSAIYGGWVEHDPSTALGYIANSGNDEVFDSISKWTLRNMFASMSNAEQSSLVAGLPESGIKQKVVAALAQEWLINGRYASVVEVLNALPDSTGRDATVAEFGSTWAMNDRKAAEAWLVAQPDSSDRDLITAGVAARLAEDDPATAIQWAATIPDVSIRIPALKNIYMGWRSLDATAADAWLITVPEFTPADRYNLINARRGMRFSGTAANRR